MAILDKAEHVQAELTKAEGMSRAVAMACGLVELQEAMSDDVVSVLMSLQGNPMGFRSDKIYPPEVVKACAISALLSGAYLVDDEWQIIAGQCYLGQKYFMRKIREYPGVTDVEITIDLPEALTPTLLVCGGYARCRKGGKRVEVFARKSDKFGDSRIAVTAHKGDIDQSQGKAKKRLAQRLYERIAGVTITDEDPVLESIDVDPTLLDHRSQGRFDRESLSDADKESVSERLDKIMTDSDWKPELELIKVGQDHIREVMNELALGGFDTHVTTIERAIKMQKSGAVDQRGIDLCRRYSNWLQTQS